MKKQLKAPEVQHESIQQQEKIGLVYALRNTGMDKSKMNVVVRIRITSDQYADLMNQASRADMTLSALMRQRVMNKAIVSRTDVETANSIDQIGRMLKHLYPKDKEWASSEDRRRWWQLAEELRKIARDVRRGSKS